jgi:hypothetical protein
LSILHSPQEDISAFIVEGKDKDVGAGGGVRYVYFQQKKRDRAGKFVSYREKELGQLMRDRGGLKIVRQRERERERERGREREREREK